MYIFFSKLGDVLAHVPDVANRVLIAHCLINRPPPGPRVGDAVLDGCIRFLFHKVPGFWFSFLAALHRLAIIGNFLNWSWSCA